MLASSVAEPTLKAPSPDLRAEARARLRRNAGHVAHDLARMAENAVRLGFTPAEIAALHLGHANIAEHFPAVPRVQAGG